MADIKLKYGPHTLTVPEYAVREAARAAIAEMHTNMVLRHDVSERGIETSLDEFMKWIIVPTLEKLQ